MFSELQICVSNTWSPTIGDPSVAGWVTVFAYIVAALLCAMVLIKRSANRRAFWYLLTIFLAVLAVNKQLDLQSAFTAVARCAAQLQGWYENRRVAQVTFILVFAAISLIVTLMVAWNLRHGLSRVWLALFGFAFLMTFVVIRAAGFHHFDNFIDFELAGIRMNWVMELTGILLISLNAINLIRQGPAPKMRRRKRKRPEDDVPFRREL